MTKHVHVKITSITTEERFTDCIEIKEKNVYDASYVIIGKLEKDNIDIRKPIIMSDYGSCAKRYKPLFLNCV